MKLPIIERRRIEALILKHVYDALEASQGKEVAVATIDAAVSRAAAAFGEEHRQALGRTPDLADMAAILPNWSADDALRIEVLEARPDRLDFNVTRCRYAEMYKEMGLGGIGHILSCNRDGQFCTGYNPDMKLDRSQTIMQGASHCDFRYKLDKTS
ncbi:MAG: L-2-amino-thiazoline-4-carboxylic acid hydrolase [Hyphomicrobium sp.]